MRLTTLTLITLTSLAAGCVGDVGSGAGRKTGRGSDSGSGSGSDDEPCTKLEENVTIRSAADMAKLPKSDCYDIYGTLTLQGQTITSLAGLNNINSVSELDLDHTAITAIDTKHPLGIYGKLTVTGNPKLTNLKQLRFETASTGILIDGNTQLTSLDALSLDAPRLEQVDGDVVITGNPALTQVPLGGLTRLTGGLTVSGNAALTTVALGKLTSMGHVEIADNAKLAALPGFTATTITGDLAIRNNPALTTLGTMSALYRVTGNVTIEGNAALTNLAAFTTSLKFIDHTLTVSSNQALVDLGSLKHVTLVAAISITNNTSLVNCRATEIDKCTQHPVSSVITNNKNVSCSWQCE